jgi:hypothetical protein
MLRYSRRADHLTERADKFVADWISDNIEAKGYQADGDFGEAHNSAEQCLIAANGVGIAESEVLDEYPDLVAHMAAEIEEANDREVRRLAESD